ncbi:hypothetical protein [Gloeomargarita sp.]
MVKPSLWRYVVRTRKFWLVGLLVVAGMALSVGAGEMLELPPAGMPWLGMGLHLWPLWVMAAPAVAAWAWAAKGMGWEVTLAGQAVMASGLVGAGMLSWLWYRQRSRRLRER